MRTGLPQELPQAVIDAIFRGIERSTARNNTILNWTPPLTVGQQMKLTLEDKQLLLADPLRRSIVVLRALALFQGRIAVSKWVDSTGEKAQGLRTREKRDSNTKVREKKVRGRKDLHRLFFSFSQIFIIILIG